MIRFFKFFIPSYVFLLLLQSTELVDAIFKSPIYLYGPKVQRCLLFMILGCKKDLHMTCWKIFRVDLTTCFKVKNIYSVYPFHGY